MKNFCDFRRYNSFFFSCYGKLDFLSSKIIQVCGICKSELIFTTKIFPYRTVYTKS